MDRTPPRTGAAFDVGDAYREHAGELYWFAVHAVGDRADAEDLVQEVFTRAWRAAASYDPARASRRTWLFAIARNLVLDTYRSRSRRPVLASVPVDAEEQVEEHPAPGPEEDVVRRVQVLEAMARLSPEHRQVVVEVHLRGTTYAELAQATGTSAATLRTRMFYGLRAMRAAMEEAGWDR